MLKPGEYTGSITVSSTSGETGQNLQVTFEVTPWRMPSASERQFHLDLWQFPVSVLKRYNDANGKQIKIWSEDHYALLEPTYRYLAELGQRTVTTYIKEGAFAAPSMISWIALEGGKRWEYDYSVFDAHVERLAEWGIHDQISAFSPVGWNKDELPFRDEATGARESIQVPALALKNITRYGTTFSPISKNTWSKKAGLKKPSFIWTRCPKKKWRRSSV